VLLNGLPKNKPEEFVGMLLKEALQSLSQRKEKKYSALKTN
jgi:hypothetical protein